MSKFTLTVIIGLLTAMICYQLHLINGYGTMVCKLNKVIDNLMGVTYYENGKPTIEKCD